MYIYNLFLIILEAYSTAILAVLRHDFVND